MHHLLKIEQTVLPGTARGVRGQDDIGKAEQLVVIVPWFLPQRVKGKTTQCPIPEACQYSTALHALRA